MNSSSLKIGALSFYTMNSFEYSLLFKSTTNDSEFFWLNLTV